jgi:hypothetical protein
MIYCDGMSEEVEGDGAGVVIAGDGDEVTGKIGSVRGICFGSGGNHRSHTITYSLIIR